MTTRLPTEPRPAPERSWPPLLASAFVLAALAALAATPTLLLQRMSGITDDVTRRILPVYEDTRDLGLALERRMTAARSAALTGDARYETELAGARADEAAAMQRLAQDAPRLGFGLAEHVTRLRDLAGQRDSVERELERAPDPAISYRAALPYFDSLRDSMRVQLEALRSGLLERTLARLEREARWTAAQRNMAWLLALLAALAALAVAWFGWRQRRLRRQVQAVLADAHRLRHEAEQRQQELERVTASRARLMRGFSHDVKNPLGAANGYLQLLADGILGTLTEEQVRSVTRASRSIENALHLVEDLLELARAESGHLEVVPVPTDLGSVVSDIANAYYAQAVTKGLSFAVQLPPETVRVRTDRRLVGRVLGNLISNAVKYTREGGVTVRVDSHGAVHGRLAITVEDTGPGIPVAQQHLLFEEFVRLAPQAGKGSGVGLTISHYIARALGGEITVESEAGSGSAFTLWLPRESAVGNAAARP